MRRIAAGVCAVMFGAAGCASTPVRASHEPPVVPYGREFAAAAPVLAPPLGPGPGQRLRSCTAAELHTSAKSVPAVTGVLGLISIAGSRCSLTVDATGIKLVDADGRVLAVPKGTQTATNPAEAVRPDLAEDSGTVKVGFAWTGSWCGSPATAVTIPALPAVIRIPLSGPSPSCHKTTSSKLTAGTVDYADRPVEPAAQAWGSLRARLVLPKVVQPSHVPMSVVLTNSASAAVSLVTPCPTYVADIMIPLVPSGKYGGTAEQTGAGGDFCSAPVVIAGRSSVTLRLPVAYISQDPRNPWMKGGTVSVDWAMAGVPTAHATARIG